MVIMRLDSFLCWVARDDYKPVVLPCLVVLVVIGGCWCVRVEGHLLAAALSEDSFFVELFLCYFVCRSLTVCFLRVLI